MQALGLLALGLFAAVTHGRLLQQTSQSQQCSPGNVSWDYSQCWVATDEKPPGPAPPPVVKASGPADDALGGLPPRWGSDPAAVACPAAEPSAASPSAPPCANTSVNPFVSRDHPPPLVMAAQGAGISGPRTIGFTTGGAQDVENFRANIKAGYLPLPTDVSFGGIVKDYYFNTSSTSASPPCTQLFCPIYSLAASPDPVLNASASAPGTNASQPQIYMAVGLDSGCQAADFHRKPLNLVLVLDVSGSMGDSFDAYYYDEVVGQQQNLTAAELNTTKIDVAKEVLTGILGLLGPNDSVSIVLFSDGACTPVPLTPVTCLDLPAIDAQIQLQVHATSGTSLSSGLDQASAVLRNCSACVHANLADTENRIIIMTDEQPNEGDYTTEGLSARLRSNAADNIFTTVFGIGLDFNTELADAIGRVRGANYFSVHRPGEFKQRLVDQFDYAVTPLVFDLSLAVDPGSLSGLASGQGWRILQVYGSPNGNDTALTGNGTITQVSTLFPSPKTDQGIKGGVVLLRMAPPPQGANTPLRLTVTYTDRSGQHFTSQRTVAVPPQVLSALQGSPPGGASSYYDSSGVRKAVLLARYTDILHDWLLDQWAAVNKSSISIPASLCATFPADYCPLAVNQYGLHPIDGSACALNRWLLPSACLLPAPAPVLTPLLGRWERQSQKLAVGPQARAAFQEFLPYFQAEEAALGDASLDQEVQIMDDILKA